MEDIRNAINSLEITLIRHGNEGLITDVFSAKTLKMAIKALEKQIPKDVNSKCDEDWEYYYCGNCNVNVDEDNNYCVNCGQKLDWD